tara:strand:+ start:4195 stop:4662 length:468 start_codon:yes stop_codon:yes gene_type:complete
MEPFNTQFTLTRDYLAECFDQTLPHGKNASPNFLFPIVCFTTGVGLLYFTEQRQIVGIILIGLAGLEFLHIRFRHAWWLARQLWGASGNSGVELTIDDASIQTHSPYAKTVVLWTEIERVIGTDLGYIFVNTPGAQQYLSKSLLPAGLIDEIKAD